MKSKRYWLNKPLLFNIIKDNILPVKITLILCIGFFMLSLVSYSALVFLYGLFGISAVLLTSLYAGIIQGYLSNKAKASYVKTLPLSSSTFWFTQYVAGFLLITVTLFLQIVLLYIRMTYWRYYEHEHNMFSNLIFATIILVFIYYTISFFVVSISGKRVGQFIFAFALYGLPLLFYIGIIQVGNTLVAGNILGLDEEILRLFLPVVSGVMYINYNTWSFFNVHIVIGILFFVGSYFAYVHRRLENTDEMILIDGIHYSIRFSIVVTATMVLYLLISQTGIIFYTYHTKDLLLAGLLYCFIGFVLAFGLELLLKSERIYRLLAMYIPLIIFSFLICIQIGRWNHNSAKAEIKNSTEIYMHVTLIKNSQFQDFAYVQITHDMYEIFSIFIEETKDELYPNVLPNGNFVTIRIHNKEDALLHYHISEATFMDFVTYNNHQFYRELLAFRYTLESMEENDASYWIINTTDEMAYAVITNADMERILNIALQSDYQEEEIFLNHSYNNQRYSAHKYNATIEGGIPYNDEIKKIIEQPENLRRANILKEANTIIEEQLSHEAYTEDVKENFIIEGENIADSYRILVTQVYYTVMSNTEISMDVNIYCVYLEGFTKHYNATIIFELQDGIIVSQKIIEKGEH